MFKFLETQKDWVIKKVNHLTNIMPLSGTAPSHAISDSIHFGILPLRFTSTLHYKWHLWYVHGPLQEEATSSSEGGDKEHFGRAETTDPNVTSSTRSCNGPNWKEAERYSLWAAKLWPGHCHNSFDSNSKLWKWNCQWIGLYHFCLSTSATLPTFALTSFCWTTFSTNGRTQTSFCRFPVQTSHGTNVRSFPNRRFLLIWWRRHHPTSACTYCAEGGLPLPDEILAISAFFLGFTFSISSARQQLTCHFFFWASTFSGPDWGQSGGMLPNWKFPSLWTTWSTSQWPK